MTGRVESPKKNYLLTTLLGSFWNVLQFITSFIVATTVSILLTRHFGSSTYGLFAYLSWFSSIVVLAMNFGLLTTVQTWVPKYYFTGELSRAAFIARKLLKAQSLVILAGLVLLVPAIFIWHKFVTFSPHQFTTLMLINLLPMIAGILDIFFSTLLVAIQRFRQAVLIYITGQVLILFSVIIVVTGHLQIKGLLLLLGAANMAMLILFIRASRDVLRQIVSEWTGPSETKKIMSFSGWAYINIILTAVIWDKSEFFFLGKFHSGTALAVYGIAYTLSTMVTTVLDPIISVFTTMLAELVAKKDWERIRFIMRMCSKYVSLLLLPLVTLAYALSHFVVRLVYGPEFIMVASIFPVLLLSITLNRIFAPAWSIPQYMHDLKKIVPRNVVVAILNITLDILLIAKYGVWGAVLANVITQIAALTYFALFMRRYGLYLFTREYFRILAINVVFFGLVFLTVNRQTTLGLSLSIGLVGLALYAYIAYKKFFSAEDRLLLKNSILAFKNRSVA